MLPKKEWVFRSIFKAFWLDRSIEVYWLIFIVNCCCSLFIFINECSFVRYIDSCESDVFLNFDLNTFLQYIAFLLFMPSKFTIGPSKNNKNTPHPTCRLYLVLCEQIFVFSVILLYYSFVDTVGLRICAEVSVFKWGVCLKQRRCKVLTH